MTLDKIDWKILRILKMNGRIRTTELAEQVGLSANPCARRVKILEDAGIIEGYCANINYAKLDRPLNIFISVELEKQDADALKVFENQIKQHDEIVEGYLMTGSQDFLLRVVASDLISYERFLQEQITRIPGIRSVRSRFALRRITGGAALPSIT